jgi:translation initiation factor 3 subunit E
VNVLYRFGQFQYNIGNYGASADLLYHFRILSTDVTMNTGAAWGKFAAEILSGNWDGAMEELAKVKEIINDRVGSSKVNTNGSPFLIRPSNFIIERG